MHLFNLNLLVLPLFEIVAEAPIDPINLLLHELQLLKHFHSFIFLFVVDENCLGGVRLFKSFFTDPRVMSLLLQMLAFLIKDLNVAFKLRF